MIERPVGFGLLALPFLGAAIEIARDLPSLAIALGVGAAGMLGVAVLTVEQRRALGLPNLVALGVMLAIALVSISTPAAFGREGAGVAVGAIVGVPWVLVAFVARPGAPVGPRIVAFGLALLAGLFALAAATLATGTTPTALADSFVSGLGTLAGQQLQVFGGLVTGAATPPLPLNAFFDPAYDLLAALSLGGFLLTIVRPQTGGQTPLPVAVRSYRGTVEGGDLPARYGFSESQREVFRNRSSGESPFLTWPPGLEPIFWGGAATAAFLFAAYLVPRWSVLGATIGMAVAVAFLVRAVERPMPAPPPKADRFVADAPPAEPSDAPPAVEGSSDE